MDKNNGKNNVFGDNGRVNELRNISSSDWAPISAGRTAGEQIRPPKKPAAQKTSQASADNRRTAEKGKNTKKASATAGKGKTEYEPLISAGRPVAAKNKANANTNTNTNTRKSQPGQKGKAPQGSQKPKQTQKKQSTQKPPSRTPKGRDMRRDAREEQEYNDELTRGYDDYSDQLGLQRNHEEISQEKNKGKQKLMLKKSVASALKIGAVALILIFLCVYNFGAITRTVIINGSNPYTDEQIQEAAGVFTGRSMFYLREKKVYRKLTKNLPYIKSVTLERDIPDTVILTVQETTAKYMITLQGKWLTLDPDGKIVSDTDNQVPDGLYRMEGFDSQLCAPGDIFVPEGENAERYAFMQQIVPILEKYKVFNKSVVNLQNMQDITITVDGRYRAYMGDCEYDLEYKIKYLSEILKEAKAIGKTGYINLRYDVGYFKPGSMEIR